MLLADPVNKATIEGLASALESSDDVSVCFDGAVVKISGTEPQVFHVARAMEAIVSENEDEAARARDRCGSVRYWGNASSVGMSLTRVPTVDNTPGGRCSEVGPTRTGCCYVVGDDLCVSCRLS